MKYGLNEAVAKYIVSAQIASDGGKRIKGIRNSLPDGFLRYENGYGDKDMYILKAIDLINRAHGTSGFSYYVGRDKDAAYGPKTVVYFNYKMHGERRQISFHSYSRSLKKFVSNRHRTTWDHKDSRANALELVQEVLSQNIQPG